MATLPTNLRKQLESVCVEAREKAETAARAALRKWAVDQSAVFAHFSEVEKAMRLRLRARGRQVGDVVLANKSQTIDALTQELAYEAWHRMLFARFLAENHLLMHPDGVAVSLEECEELAADEGAPNGYVLAARYASRMLPQIFRADDVLLEIEFAPEQRLALEKLLASLPRETFTADDSLGWVYQFWQAKRKDEVNRSGDKIDGRTLPAVTQLFTEHYMVEFLLHNTIGAWWCARHGIQGPPGGAGVPEGQAPVPLDYLRWRDDGTPAAGAFEGWPKTLRRVHHARPLLRERAFPGGRLPVAGAAAEARRGALGPRRLRRRAAGEPLRPRTRPPLHPDRGVRPGAGGVDRVRRRRPAPRPLGPAAAEHRLLGPGGRRHEGGLDAVRQRRRQGPRGDGAALRPVPQGADARLADRPPHRGRGPLRPRVRAPCAARSNAP